MILASGHRNDRDNELTLTPAQARELAQDLFRAAEESEDHGIYEVHMVSLAQGELEPIVLRVNPHLG
jgi:hypothetical protein